MRVTESLPSGAPLSVQFFAIFLPLFVALTSLGCGPALREKSLENSAAISAIDRFHVNNSSYEYAGFILGRNDGTAFYSRGRLFEIDHDRIGIGSPDEVAGSNGLHAIGFYHTHPPAPDDIDAQTGSHFSRADEDYARDYNLVAFVGIFHDTPAGERARIYRWDPTCQPSAEEEITLVRTPVSSIDSIEK